MILLIKSNDQQLIQSMDFLFSVTNCTQFHMFCNCNLFSKWNDQLLVVGMYRILAPVGPTSGPLLEVRLRPELWPDLGQPFWGHTE